MTTIAPTRTARKCRSCGITFEAAGFGPGGRCGACRELHDLKVVVGSDEEKQILVSLHVYIFTRLV